MKKENKLKNFSANSDQIDNIIKDDKHNKVIDLSSQKYIVKKIDQEEKFYMASQVSKNEKYFAYGSYGGLLKIYDLQLDKIIKEIKYDLTIQVCQFTCDSQQLLVGLYKSVYWYSVSKGFKLNHKLYIHYDYVYNIVIINKKFIITSGDYIIKTDTKQKKQLFKLQHTPKLDSNSIRSLEYNDIDDIIVSGSDDQSLKLWSCKDKRILINKVNDPQIMQIQLINNNKHLLTLNWNGELYEWKIDLVNRHLIQIQSFEDLHKIISFYQVNQGQNLLLICDQYIKILNNQGQVINIINHQTKGFVYICRQLDNANFIQIKQDGISLAIAQI